jgi:antitoxin component of MazEF toxin-antitoxin module
VQTDSDSKVFIANVKQIEENGDAVIEIPNEMVDMLGWQVGDELDYNINEDGYIVITNLTRKNNASE